MDSSAPSLRRAEVVTVTAFLAVRVVAVGLIPSCFSTRIMTLMIEHIISVEMMMIEHVISVEITRYIRIYNRNNSLTSIFLPAIRAGIPRT